jgi:uncharacterized protein (TIGR04141 family)
MPHVPVLALTVLLIKAEVADPTHALKNPAVLTALNVKDAVGFQGRFYYLPPAQKTPNWLRVINALAAEQVNLANTNSSAVLFLRASERWFALTWGYGRNFLRPHAFERDFGLRVAMNTVDPDRLKSVDAKKFEELTISTRTQTSRASTLGTFGLDPSRDLLREVAGVPRDATLCRRLTGSDSLHLVVQTAPEHLAVICSRLLEESMKDDYKDYFPSFDDLQYERDPAIINALDQDLVAKLKAQNLENLQLAPPELVELKLVAGYQYSASDSTFDEPDVEEFVQTLNESGELNALSLIELKRELDLSVVNDAGTIFDGWPIYESLVGELDLEGKHYVLTSGRWFRVNVGLIEQTNAYIQSIPAAKLDLPDSTEKEREDAYASRVKKDHPEIALIDRSLIPFGGGNSTIETCDLYTPDNQFVHIKRKTRSSTLSHLYAQGFVAAQAVAQSVDFRAAFRELLEKVGNPELAASIPDDRPALNQHEVAYVIVAKPNDQWPLSLPFFSKLALRQASERLRLLGFRVALKLVPAH